MTQLGWDSFQHPDQSGWPAATDGQSWSIQSGGATQSISSNEGVATGISSLTFIQLGSKTSADAEALIRLSASSTSFTAVGIFLRGSVASGATYTAYRFRLNFGNSTLALVRTIANASTDIATVGVTLALNTPYWIRAKLAGSNLMAKAWSDGSAEPSWMVQGTDGNITGSGGFGIVVNSTVPADTARFDNFYIVDYIWTDTLSPNDQLISGNMQVSNEILTSSEQRSGTTGLIANEFIALSTQRGNITAPIILEALNLQEVMSRLDLWSIEDDLPSTTRLNMNSVSQGSFMTFLDQLLLSSQSTWSRLLTLNEVGILQGQISSGESFNGSDQIILSEQFSLGELYNPRDLLFPTISLIMQIIHLNFMTFLDQLLLDSQSTWSRLLSLSEMASLNIALNISLSASAIDQLLSSSRQNTSISSMGNEVIALLELLQVNRLLNSSEQLVSIDQMKGDQAAQQAEILLLVEQIISSQLQTMQIALMPTSSIVQSPIAQFLDQLQMTDDAMRAGLSQLIEASSMSISWLVIIARSEQDLLSIADQTIWFPQAQATDLLLVTDRASYSLPVFLVEIPVLESRPIFFVSSSFANQLQPTDMINSLTSPVVFLNRVALKLVVRNGRIKLVGR